jgi:uncharacterized SAM-binding protein YcdF (DUF218 family)
MQASSRLGNHNIVIIGPIDWAENYQICQRLAIDLAASGSRVLFIENTGVRAVNRGDLWRLRARLRNWRRSTHGFREVLPNITLLSPILLPLPYSSLAVTINRWLLSRIVRRWTRISHFGDPVVVTFLPTPLAQALTSDLNPTLTVYYCANDMAGLVPAMAPARRWESVLFGEADVVFVTAEALRERASAHNAHVHFFPGGVEFEKFSAARVNADLPAALRGLRRPIVGYVGTVGPVLDQDLLVEMARRMPEVTLVLVGPEYVDANRLRACSNIRLIGQVPHADVPAFIKGFDVGLIPNVKTPYTDAVYSVKLNEYLAMGVPVVTTDLREMRRFIERHGPVIEIGKDTQDFIRKVGVALEETNDRLREQRIAVAETNSCERRYAGMSAIMEEHLRRRAAENERWSEALVGTYRRYRRRLFSRAAGLAALYALIFYTPLVWLAGNQLVLRQPPQAAGAIVVFSGPGEATYINASYQRRAVDAARYYQQGYAPQIVISSGIKQTFAEEEIIRALLLAQGVPRSAIQVIKDFPSSTYENVQIVDDFLKKIGVTSILFITSPYHSRRAEMIWKKLAPEVNLRTVPVVDTPPVTPQWTATVDQIRAIAYEYTAIGYNWAKGRL